MTVAQQQECERVVEAGDRLREDPEQPTRHPLEDSKIRIAQRAGAAPQRCEELFERLEREDADERARGVPSTKGAL